jgi:probable F420-dependent oxidoreductase
MIVESMLPLDDWRGAGRSAKSAEESGFDAVMTAEISHDPFTPLAFAALATERIQLGTGIVVAFPRSPMVTAAISWDLQEQSGGRFVLGLGSQVKGHIRRRFSTEWTNPVSRMREYIQSLRAIWKTWETGAALDFEGEHYRFNLMTPEFSPRPTGLPPVPVTIAAVGPDMLKMAGRICDGVILHGFCTRRYLEEVALPRLEEGLAQSHLERSQFLVRGGGFLATGPDEEAVAKSLEELRYRVAFYGSTRTYSGVLALHGYEEVGVKLHRLSVTEKWREMAKAVPDDLLHLFAAVATYDKLAAAVEKQFGGLTDGTGFGFAGGTPTGLARELIQDLKKIPCPFEGFSTSWG